MAEASQSSRTAHTSAVAQSQGQATHGGKHIHHGRTPAAWAGVALAMAGFVLGGIAMVDGPNWILFWIAAALCVIALIAAKVLQVMGFGAS
jgi:hypothetical protein